MRERSFGNGSQPIPGRQCCPYLKDLGLEIYIAANMSSRVSVHRCCLSRILLYSVIFSSMLAWIFGTESHHHDGRTVTLMLAKLGEGPLGRNRDREGAEIDCERQESCSDHRTTNVTSERAQSVQDLCWGYEKDCKKEERLFFPECQGPSKPWYALSLCSSNKMKTYCNYLCITCTCSKYIPFHAPVMKYVLCCRSHTVWLLFEEHIACP